MKTIGQVVAGARRRAILIMMRRRFPVVVTIRKFEKPGVRFEISNPKEVFRVSSYGGEAEYLGAMLNDLRPDDILYDIGANVGMLALHAASICRTIAFEPEPAFRSRLETNARLNEDRVIQIEATAVSDSDGTVSLFTDGAGGNSPSLVNQRSESGCVSVQARSLDSLTTEALLPPPTVIKLDIEGAEILALRGARELLSGKRKPRCLFVEVHDTLLQGFDSSSDEVFQLLSQFGYTKTVYRKRRGDQTHLILHASA